MDTLKFNIMNSLYMVLTGLTNANDMKPMITMMRTFTFCTPEVHDFVLRIMCLLQEAGKLTAFGPSVMGMEQSRLGQHIDLTGGDPADPGRVDPALAPIPHPSDGPSPEGPADNDLGVDLTNIDPALLDDDCRKLYYAFEAAQGGTSWLGEQCIQQSADVLSSEQIDPALLTPSAAVSTAPPSLNTSTVQPPPPLPEVPFPCTLVAHEHHLKAHEEHKQVLKLIIGHNSGILLAAEQFATSVLVKTSEMANCALSNAATQSSVGVIQRLEPSLLLDLTDADLKIFLTPLEDKILATLACLGHALIQAQGGELVASQCPPDPITAEEIVELVGLPASMATLLTGATEAPRPILKPTGAKKTGGTPKAPNEKGGSKNGAATPSTAPRSQVKKRRQEVLAEEQFTSSSPRTKKSRTSSVSSSIMGANANGVYNSPVPGNVVSVPLHDQSIHQPVHNTQFGAQQTGVMHTNMNQTQVANAMVFGNNASAFINGKWVHGLSPLTVERLNKKAKREYAVKVLAMEDEVKKQNLHQQAVQQIQQRQAIQQQQAMQHQQIMQQQMAMNHQQPMPQHQMGMSQQLPLPQQQAVMTHQQAFYQQPAYGQTMAVQHHNTGSAASPARRRKRNTSQSKTYKPPMQARSPVVGNTNNDHNNHNIHSNSHFVHPHTVDLSTPQLASRNISQTPQTQVRTMSPAATTSQGINVFEPMATPGLTDAEQAMFYQRMMFAMHKAPPARSQDRLEGHLVCVLAAGTDHLMPLEWYQEYVRRMGLAGGVRMADAQYKAQFEKPMTATVETQSNTPSSVGFAPMSVVQAPQSVVTAKEVAPAPTPAPAPAPASVMAPAPAPTPVGLGFTTSSNEQAQVVEEQPTTVTEYAPGTISPLLLSKENTDLTSPTEEAVAVVKDEPAPDADNAYIAPKKIFMNGVEQYPMEDGSPPSPPFDPNLPSNGMDLFGDPFMADAQGGWNFSDAIAWE